VARDVDDATLLEESAEELYEYAPAGYLSTQPGGLIVKVNATLLEWTGYERDALVGRTRFHDLLAPGARIYYETHYAPLLAMQGEVRAIAVELVRADGTRLPVLLNSTLVRDDAGEPRVIRTTVFDASERRRYERELQRLRLDAEARANAALALAHVHDGVLHVTAEGRVGVVNPAAERIVGLAAPELLGRALLDVVPEWAEVEAHAPAGRSVVVPLVRGGHEQWLAVARVDTEEGEVVWTFRDVTADHTLERMRGDLVAIVSHELRTPLAGVYGSAQTLLSRYDDLGDDTRKQLLAMLVEQSERLTRLLDQILLTSRLDSGELRLAQEKCDAARVAGEAVSSLPGNDQARVVVDVADAAVNANADAARQVLTILLDNALKYSAGTVRLEGTQQRGVVRFVVADEGPGIPPATRERIFERFHRLDPEQRRGVGGAGLGLYIARELTERQGGRIALEPTESGTRMAVDLPALDSRG
jgi:PAS domain S-box-containing protein